VWREVLLSDIEGIDNLGYWFSANRTLLVEQLGAVIALASMSTGNHYCIDFLVVANLASVTIILLTCHVEACRVSLAWLNWRQEHLVITHMRLLLHHHIWLLLILLLLHGHHACWGHFGRLLNLHVRI